MWLDFGWKVDRPNSGVLEARIFWCLADPRARVSSRLNLLMEGIL